MGREGEGGREGGREGVNESGVIGTSVGGVKGVPAYFLSEECEKEPKETSRSRSGICIQGFRGAAIRRVDGCEMEHEIRRQRPRQPKAREKLCTYKHK